MEIVSLETLELGDSLKSDSLFDHGSPWAGISSFICSTAPAWQQNVVKCSRILLLGTIGSSILFTRNATIFCLGCITSLKEWSWDENSEIFVLFHRCSAKMNACMTTLDTAPWFSCAYFSKNDPRVKIREGASFCWLSPSQSLSPECQLKNSFPFAGHSPSFGTGSWQISPAIPSMTARSCTISFSPSFCPKATEIIGKRIILTCITIYLASYFYLL